MPALSALLCIVHDLYMSERGHEVGGEDTLVNPSSSLFCPLMVTIRFVGGEKVQKSRLFWLLLLLAGLVGLGRGRRLLGAGLLLACRGRLGCRLVLVLLRRSFTTLRRRTILLVIIGQLRAVNFRVLPEASLHIPVMSRQPLFCPQRIHHQG
jgi:hypothetical protein